MSARHHSPHGRQDLKTSLVGLERWKELLAPLHWDGRHNTAVRREARLRNDTSVATSRYYSHFVRLMREGQSGSGAWREAPVNYHPHEGAFYPAWLLRDFTERALNGTRFAAALAAQQAGRRCPCCEVYQVTRLGAAGGSCNLEELLLPTFIWQHYPRLISRAAPPLILRVWADLNNMRLVEDNLFAQVACHLKASPAGFSHFFGVKVPHFYFGRMASYLRKPMSGGC